MPTFARTHKIVYNANGGTGAPASVTRTGTVTPSAYPATVSVGVDISTTHPTRTGYTFRGWALSAGGSAQYTGGETLYHTWTISSSQEALTGTFTSTLYAAWQAVTYTVQYNANGGSGAPGKQTKTHGVTLKLSATTPTRSGWTFAGWNTNAAGTGTNYAAGANYTANASVTLYAKWTRVGYAVKYNANGGSGAPTQQTKEHGITLTLSSTRPTRTGYAFMSWNTSSDGSGTTYQPGSSYTANAAVTLYAIWHKLATVTVTEADALITTARTVTITRGAAGDRVTVTASVNGSAAVQLYDGTGASFAWNTAGYGQYITTDMGADAVLTVTTYANNAAVGTTAKQHYLAIPEYTPTASQTITNADNALQTRFGTLVKGQSRAKVTVSAATQYGATVTRIVTAVDGTAYAGESITSAVLTTAGSMSVRTRADDSRGRSVTTVGTATVDDWYTPGLSVTVKRAGTEAATIKITYNVAPIDSAGKPNDKTYSVEYKRTTDTQYTTAFSGNLPQYAGTLTLALEDLEAGGAYNVRVSVADYFAEVKTEKVLPAADTVVMRAQVSDTSLHFPRHTVIEASYEIGEGAWRRYTALESTADLNDLTVPGSYKANTNEIAGAIENSPTGYAFIMTVENSRGEETGSERGTSAAIQRRQTVSDYFGNTYKRRIVIPATGNIEFMPWRQDTFADGTTPAALFEEVPELEAVTQSSTPRATWEGGYLKFGKLVYVSATASVTANLTANDHQLGILPRPARLTALTVAAVGTDRGIMPLSATIRTNGGVYVDHAATIPNGATIHISGIYMAL